MGKKVLCAFLVAAMILTSTDFTVLAEETKIQVTDGVVEEEEQPIDETVAEGEQTPDGTEESDSDGTEESDSDGAAESDEQTSEDASSEDESETSDSEETQDEAVEETTDESTDESTEISDENTETEQEFLEEENTETVTTTGEVVYAGETASGICGDNLTWKLENGTLTISGTGDMYDYDYTDNNNNLVLSITTAPWGEYCRNGNIALCIEEGVTSIGYSAFYGCRGLTGSLVIPDGVTRIGDYAFYYCCFLSGELVIPGSTSSIGNFAFEYCTRSTSLKISEGVTSIGDCAFRHCEDLSGELIIPDSVTSIGEWAFCDCYNIEKLVLSNNLSSIGYWTFGGNVNLPMSIKGPLIIPKSVTSIGELAFYNCVNIKNIYLYDTLSSIYSGQYNSTPFNGIPKSDIVFHCIKDSYAYEWAEQNGFNVVEWDGEAIDMDDVYLDDIKVIKRGYAYANFILKNNKGEVQKNAKVRYSFDGQNYNIATSDENGYISLKSYLIINISGKEETKHLKTTEILLCYDDSDKQEKLNYNVIMDVTAQPLSFTQNWELNIKGSVTGSAGEGVGIKVGVAKAEAALAKAEIEAEGGVSLSVEHSFDENGERNLTLFQTFNSKVTAKADIGPAAEAGSLGTNLEVEVKAAEVEGSVAAGASVGIGLNLEDYDPENIEQITEIGKFILASHAQARGDRWMLELAELAGYNFYNMEQYGATISVGAGAELGSFGAAGVVEGALAAANVKRIVSFDAAINKDDNSKEYAFGLAKEDSAGFGEFSILDLQKNILSIPDNYKLEISAELDGNNQIQNFAVKKEWKEVDNGILINEEKVDAVEISYGRDAVEQIKNNIGVIGDFASGSTRYILGNAQKELFEKLDMTPLKGTYSTTVADQKYYDIDFDFGLQAGLGLEAGVGFEGVYSFEYETEGGTYESGTRYKSNENEIEVAVKEKSYDLKKLVAEPLVTVKDSLGAYIKDLYGSVEAGIENGWAHLQQAVSDGFEKTKDWVLHLVSLNKDGSNAGRLAQSYEITAYSMEKAVGQATDGGTEIKEYKVYTIGDSYCVYVTDESGNEVTDYSDNPLLLTLGYSDEMLTAAGLSRAQAGNIAVYMYSEEVYGYICIGGTVNAGNKSVSVEITQPGQYVLAADASAPVITDIKVSQNTDKPEITVEFEEASGFKEFSLKLDDEEVIGTSDWNKYYNKAFRRISYQVEKELAAGRHTVSAYAVDSAGNAMTKPYEIEFYVGNILYTVTFDTDDGAEPVIVKIVEGVPFTLPDNPTRVGYTFQGWYTEQNGKGTEFTAQSEITADMTVYAYWLDIESGDVLEEDIPSDNIIPDGIWVAGITDFVYTGTNISQSFRIYDGKKMLKEKTDYTVSYKNNKTAYTYTDEDYAAYEAQLLQTGKSVKTGTFDPKKAPQIIINMKGNYSGKRTLYFRIEPDDISGDGFEADSLTVTYTGKKQTPTPKLIWNGKTLKYGTDFYIPEYDNAKKDGKAFTEAKTYTITLTGKKNFKGELPITLTISNSAKQIAMSKVTVNGIKSMPWTGQQIVQTGFTVKYKNTVLSEENGDYTVQWGVNSDVGTGTVIFIGTGEDRDGDGFSFVGTRKVSFKITGTSMSKVSVSGVKKDYTYTGSAIEPTATLTYKANKNAEAVTLREKIHYNVMYQKNEDKGTATLIFTGLESGGYTGTKKYTFKILSKELGDDINIAFRDTENSKEVYTAPYMKGGAKPQVIVTDGKKTLEQDKDYKISYTNNKKLGSSTDAKAPAVIITGKGNYKGSKRVNFSIAPKALSNENGISVVAKDKAASTKGGGFKQTFKVYDADGAVLGQADYDSKKVTYTLIQTRNTDGTVSIENKVLDKDSVVPAGSVIQITVQGKGIYEGGKATGTYRILENNHDISKATIQISDQPYTGEPVFITEQSQFKTGKVYVNIGKEKKELILGEDIEVVPGSYVKNVNKGTAKVTFRGINDFGGSKTVSFKIGTRSIADIWKGIYKKVFKFFG